MHEDHEAYFGFTYKQRCDRAITTLTGILQGIGSDRVINHDELEALTIWIREYSGFEVSYPFDQILPILRASLADGILTEDELADLLWLLARLNPENGFFEAPTTLLQEMQGFLAGIVCDGQVNRKELVSLQAWLDDQQDLKGCWPFDEVESLVHIALSDGHIDQAEQQLLLNYFSQWTTIRGGKSLTSLKDDDSRFGGICSLNPEIIFENKCFCLTGASSRGKRKDIESAIAVKGGRCTGNIVQSLDYLVVCDEGNPCWAYSCYGRKIEKVMNLRRSGSCILIVHEADLFDALN